MTFCYRCGQKLEGQDEQYIGEGSFRQWVCVSCFLLIVEKES